MDFQRAITEAKAHLAQSAPDEAFTALNAHSAEVQKRINESQFGDVAESTIEEYLVTLGETLFELTNVEQAYEVFKMALAIGDGYEKHLWLGQLVGGSDGIEHFATGTELLRKAIAASVDNSADPAILTTMTTRYVRSLLSMIEIWMTDLCMEAEAESQCDKLISEALQHGGTLPEVYATLASIRISQVRHSEARDAINKAWELQQQIPIIDEAETIQNLLTLTRLALEMEQYDIVKQACAAVSNIDDQVADAPYLDGYASYLQARAAAGDGPLKVGAGEPSEVSEARAALLAAEAVIRNDTEGLVDPELSEHVQKLLEELGREAGEAEDGEGGDVDEENWEDEILSGGEQ